MAKKKRKSKSAAANQLIDHLIDDAKGIAAESSFSSVENSDYSMARKYGEDENVVGIGLMADANEVDNHTQAQGIWGNLAFKQEPQLESEDSEFDAAKELENVFEPDHTIQFDRKISLEPMVGTDSKNLPNFPEMPDPLQSDFNGDNFVASHFESEAATSNLNAGAEMTSSEFVSDEDRTVALGDYLSEQKNSDNEATGNFSSHAATVAVESLSPNRKKLSVQERVSIGNLRSSQRGVMTGYDASLAQSESLKMAQDRILDLEKEIDRLRLDNDELSSAAEIIRNRLEELTEKEKKLEQEKSDIQEQARSEGMIVKGHLNFKESENSKLKMKIEELESRLKSDFKRIRVRERELENRLELARAEKNALVKAKDEQILDLKRKVDQVHAELDSYKSKVLELNKTIVANQEQFKRTVKALRLALTNLEVSDEAIVALKKAE